MSGVAAVRCFEVDLVGGPSEAEAAAVVRLLAAYASHPLGGAEPLSPTASSRLVAELRARAAWAHVFLAVDERGPAPEFVGLLTSFEGFSTFACRPLLNVHDVFVDERYRGLGLAAMLLRAAERTARALGMCKLTLEVLSGNEAAKRAYRKCGFQAYRLSDEFGTAEFWQKPIE